MQEQVPDSELGLIPSLNALDGFDVAIKGNDKAIDKLINGLGELDKNKFVYSSDHYKKERARKGNLLKLVVEERGENSKKLNEILKTVIPTEEELNKVAELAKAHNAANPRDLKTPQDIALDDPALKGKLFDRAGDGFDDVRKDREMASAIFNAYLEKARLNPNPKAYELATRVPFIGGVVAAVNSFSKKGDAKSLEMSPPKGFHKDKNLYWTGEHLDYEHALASMASWTAAMEAEHGKTWFEGGGWKAWDAAMEGRVADVQKQGRLAGMGFLGQKTWDLITMAPGFATEFYYTAPLALTTKATVNKGAAAMLTRQANRAAARNLGPLMAKATRLGVTKSYQLGRFATSTGVQTLGNPQLILRNLGMEAEQDIHLEVNDAGNMVWRTEDMEMGLDLTRAYAHSLSEIGSERLGEVFAKTKAWRAVSNAFHDAKKITPGIKPSRLDELARKAGYQGPVLEMMEERANDISTYLYDIYSGKEEFTRESLDRRVGQAYTDGQIFAELVAFTLFGTGMKMGQTAMSQIQFEDSKRAIGKLLLKGDRAKWDKAKAEEIIHGSPHLQHLRSYTGRVLLFQDINDPKGEKVVAVKVGEGAEETTSGIMQGEVNSDLNLRGVYQLKAGVPSEVFTATWNQSDGQKQHTFNSVEDAQAHAKALVEVGNEEAAKSIMDQAYLSMQPPVEIDALDMNDSGVINRVRLGKSRIRLADVQKIVGGQVTETDLGYRVQLSYGNLDINFQEDKITAENVERVLYSALEDDLVTQEQIDAAVTIEQKLELAEREKLKIAGGVFPVLDLNGVKVPGNFLMKLDLNADSATFRHEAIHFFRASGVINEKQWNSITDRVAPKEKEQLRKAKEDQAPEEVIDKLEDRIEEKVAYAIENRTDTRLPGESRLIDEVIKLLDKLRNLTRYVNTRSLWRGMESGQFAGVAPKKGAGAAAGMHSIQAFHGSPIARLTGLSTDAIGSGQGAIARGHGLYFSSAQEVAEHYKGQDGSGYKVELAPEQDELLQWDKTLADQPERVQKALRDSGILEGLGGAAAVYARRGGVAGKALTGEKLYWSLVEQSREKMGYDRGLPTQVPVGAAAEASSILRTAGVRGVRYKGKQGVEKGKDGFVIFSDKDVRVTGHFSVQGRDPILKAAAQEMRAGNLTGEQYRSLVQELDPILPRTSKPTLPSEENLEKYLGKKRAKLGLPEGLDKGNVYDFRIDIGTYNRSYSAVEQGE